MKGELEVLTASHVLDRLQKFDIDQRTLDAWEGALGLNIPVKNGEKQYSPHHINLFKNVKKNLALGRSLDEIRSLITLPPEESLRPVQQYSAEQSQTSQSSLGKMNAQQPSLPRSGKKQLSDVLRSKPFTPPSNSAIEQKAARQIENFTATLDRVLAEKDGLQKKIIETEKLNSHLYNANNMYHRKVKELNKNIEQLQGQLKEDQNFKLLDEKARLHGQLLQSEKMIQERNQGLEVLQQALAKEKANSEEIELVLSSKIRDLDTQLATSVQGFDPQTFCGNWEENSSLSSVVYDNFGINVEPSRNRVFQVSEPPTNCYGNAAVIATQYEYENNAMWKRYETLMLTAMTSKSLEGQLIVEYIIDDVPVCKAIYTINCQRQIG